MLYQATHTTRYLYDEPVAQCLSEAHLVPRNFPGQVLHQTRLHVEPEPAVLESRKDYFGNDVTTFAVFRMHEVFSATATSVIDVGPRPVEQEAEILEPKIGRAHV